MNARLLDLTKILRGRKSAFLFGPRGVGKTTLARKYLGGCKESFAIDLLRSNEYSRYLKQPDLLRAEVEKRIKTKHGLVVLVDEIQKLPQLLDEIHAMIFDFKGSVSFLLTGSSARKLKRSGVNLLAGRAWTLNLHSFTHLECEWDLDRVLKYGSLPGVYFDNEAPHRTLEAYVGTYLREEIQQEALVRNLQGFARFLEVASQMNGEPINFSDIGREASVNFKTAQEYFSILVDTMLVHKIEPWTRSVRKQIQQSPKYYFFDCGVLNSLKGELQAELRPSSFRFGKLFETMVVQELWRINDYKELGFRFHYWRTNTGLEVDLVLTRGSRQRPLAIEIKSSESPKTKDIHALKSFLSDNPASDSMVLSNSPRAYDIDGIPVYPWQDGIEKLFK